MINRTTGSASVVPELAYPDVEQAIDWLCDADPQYGRAVPGPDQPRTHSVMVKVDDVDGHHARARQHGARILSPPADYAYGERQYSVEDLAGHRWTFTQAIADVLPEDWGGRSTPTPTGSDG